jgi:YVTN family beta-propeller protein
MVLALASGFASLALGGAVADSAAQPVSRAEVVTNPRPLNSSHVGAGARSGNVVKRASSAIAVRPDGALVATANPDSGTVSVIDAATLEVAAEIAVGADPRTVAFDNVGRVWVANHGADSVSVVTPDDGGVAEVPVGTRPYGIVVAPDGNRVFVSERGGGRVVAIDAARLEVVAAFELGGRPAGLAITDDGATLVSTHLLAPRLSVIDLATGVVDTVALFPTSNLVQSVVMAPGTPTALVPHTRSNNDNRALTFDTTVFPLVSMVDVPGRRHRVGEQLSLETVDPPGVGLPFDAAVSADGVAWVVHAASNDLTVVDLASRARLAHVEVGDNPRGIVLDPGGDRAFVNNTLSGTVSVIDAASFDVVAEIRATRLPLPPTMLAGKRLFWSSDDPRLARDQWISCASCHFEGEHDGRTWHFAFAGPRNTTSLMGMVQSYPLRWSAEWDESADSEFAITEEQFGSGLLDGGMHDPLGLPNAERTDDLDALGAYLDGLTMPANRVSASLDPIAVARGRALYSEPATACLDCHPPPYYTDFDRHDVGTADGPDERLGPEIDTPTLRDLARSAPYLHDGSATTLRDVLTVANPDDRHGGTSHLGPAEIDDLAAYLLSLPANNHAEIEGPAPLSPAVAHARGKVGSGTLPPPRRGVGRVALVPVRGRVTDAGGAPVAGATVTLRATDVQSSTDAAGRFTLAVPQGSGEIEVAAWAPGTYIASRMLTPPAAGIELELRPLHEQDHPDYEWIDPGPDPAEPKACGNCHPSILPQWRNNAHGGAVSNPRFFSFYQGTDVDGRREVSPGYLLDFPGTGGNCAACHAPGAAVDGLFGTPMVEVRDRVTAGVHCDFCHKIGGLWLRPRTREVYGNMPGVFALDVRRPPSGDQVFFGPYPDVADPDTYLPDMEESAFCAPCHQFAFWGTPIYTSYDEWLASAWSDPITGKTCQECHMPPNGDNYFALPERGGLWHPADRIPAHLQLGVDDAGFMIDAIDLTLAAEALDDVIEVTATVTNSGAGHHYPTDHPGRHLLLVIRAVDAVGQELELVDGERIPTWGGDLAGVPGVGFAKILVDVESGEWPVASYWRPTLIRDDSRLAALASRTARFRFSTSLSGGRVQATLVFRRLFQPIARRYGWQIEDLVLDQREVIFGSDLP